MTDTADSRIAKYIETQTIRSRIGTLEFERGFPAPDTVATLFEFRTFYRAVEVMTQNVFAASLARMRNAYAAAGASRPNQVLVWKQLMDSKSIFLTANTETIYAMTFLDLKTDGPTVIQAPPKLLGLLDDLWMRHVGDIGAMGPDRGAGGKFLVLPPGYDGPVPDGHHVFRSRTYGVWVALRAGLEDGSTDAANERYEQLAIYPLSKADHPEPTTLMDASGLEIDTVHDENYSFLEELGELVEAEHPDALPEAQRFLLASIGMEFGVPFRPDPQVKRVLEQAAVVGGAMLRANMWDYVDDAKWIYPDRKWWTPMIGGSTTFDANGFIDYDLQALFAFYATGITPAMASKMVGLGSQYLATHQAADGAPLNGAKTYRLRVPAGVPAKQFWSMVVYDSASRSMLQTSHPMPSLSTYTQPTPNEDGSVDLYFGPQAPDGWERNWIETVPGKGWTGIFRLYGPLESFFDQTWKLNDIEPLG